MSIPVNELRPGDLIFTYNIGPTANDNLGIGEGTVRAGHVSMVTHVDGPAVQVSHSVDMPPSFKAAAFTPNTLKAGDTRPRHYGGYRQADQRVASWRGGAITTDLRIDETQITRARAVRYIGRKPFVADAVSLATRWVGMEVPYSRERCSAAEYEERPFKSAAAFVEAQRQRFFRDGIFRIIKYAARRDTFLSYPKSADDAGQGMFCSMFVAVCLQVAAVKAFVDTETPTATSRISDKKLGAGAFADLQQTYGAGRAYAVTQDLARYGEYTRRGDASIVARPGSEGKAGVQYRASIEFWKPGTQVSISNFAWAEHLTSGLMLDPKLIHPTGLFACLTSDAENWSDLGHVVGEAGRSESEHDRAHRLLETGRMVDFQRTAFGRGAQAFPGTPKGRQ